MDFIFQLIQCHQHCFIEHVFLNFVKFERVSPNTFTECSNKTIAPKRKIRTSNEPNACISKRKKLEAVDLSSDLCSNSAMPVKRTIHGARKRYFYRNKWCRCNGIRRSELSCIKAECVKLGCGYNDPFKAKTEKEFMSIHKANKMRLQRKQAANKRKEIKATSKAKAKSKVKPKCNAQSKPRPKSKQHLFGRVTDEDVRKVHEECILFDCPFTDPRYSSNKTDSLKLHRANMKRLERRKEIFRDTIHVPHPPIDFSKFHIQEAATKNKLETFYRAECRMFRLEHMFCTNCHQRRLTHMEYNQKNVKKGCTMCESCRSDSIKYSASNNALPVWKDTLTGKIYYHIPDELKDLTIGEKMLIQKASPVVPLVHIKNGTFGIKGHVCALPQHIDSICTELPRTKCQIVKVLKSGMSKDGSIHTKLFKIRKKKILDALHWLRKHSNVYKDIEILEENLDWMGDAPEANIQDIVEFDGYFDDMINDDKGPAPQQVFPDGVTDTIGMETSGILSDKNATVPSKTDETVLDQLKQLCINNVDASDHINWPMIETEAIKERDEKIFCMAFPWLFPGGVGDINDCRDIPLSPKEWAKNMIFYGDGRFQRDELFPFYALDFVTR